MRGTVKGKRLQFLSDVKQDLLQVAPMKMYVTRNSCIPEADNEDESEDEGPNEGMISKFKNSKDKRGLVLKEARTPSTKETSPNIINLSKKYEMDEPEMLG